MKIFTILFITVLFSPAIKAQNIDNPSFDSVYIGGIDRIYNWITSDSWSFILNDTVQPLYPDSHYVSFGFQYHELLRSVQLEYSNAFHGPLAIQLFADTSSVDIFGSPFPGFIVNGNHFYTNSDGYLDLVKCGTPFSYRPDKLRGHYQYEDNSPLSNNFPKANLLLKKYNTLTQQSDTIGYGYFSAQLFPTASWRLFEMPITYLSNQTPDSIVVAFFAPGQSFNSTFKVDSLGFEYSSPVSVKDPQEKAEMVHYIVGSTLFFSQPEAISNLQIFNYQGKKVHFQRGGGETDLSDFDSGAYLISLLLKNGKSYNFKVFR